LVVGCWLLTVSCFSPLSSSQHAIEMSARQLRWHFRTDLFWNHSGRGRSVQLFGPVARNIACHLAKSCHFIVSQIQIRVC